MVSFGWQAWGVAEKAPWQKRPAHSAKPSKDVVALCHEWARGIPPPTGCRACDGDHSALGGLLLCCDCAVVPDGARFNLLAREESMRFLITTLAAISAVAFTFDIASARKGDNPNSYYEASGQHHSGRVNPLTVNNPPVKKTTGKKNN